jgi:hypothetical protein
LPALKLKKGKDEYYVQTSISGQVITYQLTSDGKRKLLASGLGDGDRFGRAILIHLLQSGDAFTHGTGLQRSPDSDRQLQLDFPDDPLPEVSLPACSVCASLENLHLVTTAVHEEGKQDAYLLCASCRNKESMQRDVSIPLPLVSRPVFLRLQDWKLIQRPEMRVQAYGNALNTDFEKKWEELRKSKSQPKTGLLPMDNGSPPKLFT